MKRAEIKHSESYCDAQHFESGFGEILDWTLHELPLLQLAKIIEWNMDEAESLQFANCAAENAYEGNDLVASIQQDGIQQPLVEVNGMLEGNHRFAAAFALGLKTVPVYRGSFQKAGAA